MIKTKSEETQYRRHIQINFMIHHVGADRNRNYQAHQDIQVCVRYVKFIKTKYTGHVSHYHTPGAVSHTNKKEKQGS
ncbi:hypothetical protein D3C78_1710090 [compost metagenome]